MIFNNLEIVINVLVEQVWTSLTNTDAFQTWMKNVKVQTDWKIDSDITYTCYNENGNVLQWDGMDMIWEGKIKNLEINKEFTCTYPSKSTGLIEESYFLEPLEGRKTKLIMVQHFTTQQIADGYKEGTLHTLQLLKSKLENK